MLKLNSASRFLVCPDKFKGTLTASEACEAIARGIRSVLPNAEIISLPMADGGEGSSEIAAKAIKATRHPTTVLGPLQQTLESEYFLAGTTALIGYSSAAGFQFVSNHNPDTAIRSTSYGVGQLMEAAVRNGARRLMVFLGGSATTDGGVGLLQALGLVAHDRSGKTVTSPIDILSLQAFSPKSLQEIIERFSKIEVLVLTDVTNPLVGPTGAAHTFGPQKGADPKTVKLLDEAIAKFAIQVEAVLGAHISEQSGMGAAGGASFALAALGGKIHSGAESILDLLNFDKKAAASDLIITGEGSIDAQSFSGKVLSEIILRSRRLARPVWSFGGRVTISTKECEDMAGSNEFQVHQLAPETSLVEPAASLEECVRKALKTNL